MNSQLKSFSMGLVTAFGLASSVVSSQAQNPNATATISNTGMSGSLFDYTITLHNAGTSPLESFWYAWTATDDGNLSAPPSNPESSLGWVDTGIDGSASISWEGNSGDALAAGASATFTFASSENPTQITTTPSGESVAYVGGIDFSQGASGDSTPVFSPVLQSVPEPSSLGLMAVGLLGLLLRAVPATRPLFGILKK